VPVYGLTNMFHFTLSFFFPPVNISQGLFIFGQFLCKVLATTKATEYFYIYCPKKETVLKQIHMTQMF